MGKLYFKYGTMGSSKTAQALMSRFNYIQKGFHVLLIKPTLDTRDKDVKSRIGLSAECVGIQPDDNLCKIINKDDCDVIIVDECQFLTKSQVEELKEITEYKSVMCYGLLTNYKTELFEGSKRLIELADSISEIKTVCKCGNKTTVNARIINGRIAVDGPEIMIGADERYESMCYSCFKKGINRERGLINCMLQSK